MKKNIPITGKNVESFIGLALHIMTMHDDSYLVGHPEWHELVKEAKLALESENIKIK